MVALYRVSIVIFLVLLVLVCLSVWAALWSHAEDTFVWRILLLDTVVLCILLIVSGVGVCAARVLALDEQSFERQRQQQEALREAALRHDAAGQLRHMAETGDVPD
ncbi:hypothetical protein HYZ99_03520 [Candidatus Peregrinibacteria bacterium]|nr:hypothetical protein [Candidatus Peregrinibacteria bacterium]